MRLVEYGSSTHSCLICKQSTEETQDYAEDLVDQDFGGPAEGSDYCY